ncbi:PREDICTED: serpin B4 [Drosophila arizonae]|uniref:Serpin B4 n=1 Tax=Drosophila arizonae TaxID=7263 RepID=A0ABM1NWD7_DROAR|nr:PREDICTED: serpin B4 [Drosophila arizonae]
MLGSLFLLAFACLFVIGNGDLDLWRDVRRPEHQALLQKLNEAHSTARPAYLAPTAPPPPLPQYLPSVPAMAQSVAAFPSIEYAGSSSGNVDVAASDDIARNVLTFAQNLSNQINANYRKTVIFSPLSIVSALALLLLGAKGRSYSELVTVFGQTDMVKLHEQFGLMLQDVQQPTSQTTSPVRQLDAWHSNSLRRSLRNYPRNRHAPQEVHVANGLFVKHGYNLNPDYRQAVVSIYKSELQMLDFANSPATARYNINSWVEQQTKGKIENIIPDDLPQETRIVMANTLYFKAMWEIDFIASATKVENFYPNGEGSQPVIPVDMMVGAGAFPYYEDQQLDCRIIGLPYHGNLTTMYVIQPMRSSVEQLAYLQQRLSADAIENMISQMTRRSTIIAFPKMHLTESFKLNTLLQSMGIGGIFNPVQNDLSLIASNEPTVQAPQIGRSYSDGLGSLQRLVAQRQLAQSSKTPTPPSDLIVSDILHKVDFTVNEQGTEAAAATAAILKKSGPEVLFRAETPFILLVRHDLTKLPLFYGMINEPPTAKASLMHKN